MGLIPVARPVKFTLIHVRRQYQFVTEGDGEKLIDEILIYEQLDDDMSQWLKKFGLATDSIQKLLTRDILHYYDSVLLEVVNRICKMDFEVFSYHRLEGF